MAWLAMQWSVRQQARRTAVELLGSRLGVTRGRPAAGPVRRACQWSGLLLGLAGAVFLVATTPGDAGLASAQAFFAAGALLLVAGLCGVALWLRRLEGDRRLARSVVALGLTNSVRRRGRSLATASLIACGSFLVLAVSVYRLEGVPDPGDRKAGTGGFALIGESTLPVLHPFDTEDGREALGLDPEDVAGIEVVPLRVRDGDVANCLNLNLSQQPRLVGVNPAALASRDAFTFARTLTAVEGSPWTSLTAPAEGPVPAIGDQASVQWALHKKVGDLLSYTDERGRTFDVQIVGTVANSILQGNLLIAEEAFTRHFPSEPGYRMLLLDAPRAREAEIQANLEDRLADLGMSIHSTQQRLAEFQAVQNTYLLIFQLLGALGLFLGSVGLAMVVLRNVFERQRELGVTRAVGFTPRDVARLVLSEHVFLLLLGLLVGGVASLAALVPMTAGPGESPWRTAAVVLGGVGLLGLFWVWLATRGALRGSLLQSLREEG